MNRKLRELLSTEEYALFLQAIYDTAIQFPDIIGVLGVGTLVHSLEIPADFFTPRFNTALRMPPNEFAKIATCAIMKTTFEQVS